MKYYLQQFPNSINRLMQLDLNTRHAIQFLLLRKGAQVTPLCAATGKIGSEWVEIPEQKFFRMLMDNYEEVS